MLIEPTPQERARDRNAPARVCVDTWSTTRISKPLEDEGMQGEAFLTALEEAVDSGYEAVAYVSVVEFYEYANLDKPMYRYVWEFTAHKS